MHRYRRFVFGGCLTVFVISVSVLIGGFVAEKSRGNIYKEMQDQNNEAAKNINENINVSSSDKIITLSTCTNVDEQRLLVEAVLIDEK